MNNVCGKCKKTFEISEQDLQFNKKISPVFGGRIIEVPPPTLCPDCRTQRRFAFRNERKLYHRKSSLTDKQIISNIAPDAPFSVYSHEEWWSDRWDAKNFGVPFDFQKTFFEQYAALQSRVPQLALSVWNSENSTYCNYVGNVKDSYLIFGSVYSEDCYYGSPYYSKNCLDTLVVRECERCYECVDCRKLYECVFCQDCHSSRNLAYCYDLMGCSDCIGCVGLRRKQYCIFNKQYSKGEYEKAKSEFNLCDEKTRNELNAKLNELKLATPRRFMQSNQADNVSGNYIYQSKNALNSFYVDRSQDVKYCAQVVDLKDCYDNNFTEENELCYEYLGAYQVSRTLFSKFCNKVDRALYCHGCFTSHDLFGCVGMRNSQYCILNKQYSKDEFEGLVPKIIEHMQTTNEWGEFFPVSVSPFAYNETVAQEYFSLNEKQVNEAGYRWKNEEKIQDNYLGPRPVIPQNIEEVDDSICSKILLCLITETPYKIIPQELKFYKEMKLPIPLICPDQRHRERLNLRNPRILWERKCDYCQVSFQTTFPPNYLGKIYCEKCYLGAIY